MIIKCKMCGGDIQFNSGDTVGQCDHCGCTTTFPKLPDEQRTNLFNRANHFRRQCEFDKAMAAYEHIVEEDDTDAEAHWGIVLSKYGIEYVEDPVTHERIPTCHRAQVISILSDEDYQNALKNAPDTHSREVYEKEAKRIAEIQKGILAISSQEKPYDVFICYKETDDNGSRTKDSALAQDIYYQLINEGYKVFFSRITLEDKLGQEYEPYIFAALNSAKVMLVVGTKPENFSAVWVKNEWSRFLAIMKNDRKRVLIPCYRDMDPYDLPEELSSLQSQDMSKIGFMQDIIHGVKKVLGADKQKAESATVQTAGPGVSSLHKRAVLFLEDSDWDSATDYFDRILDIDPEYAPAYIGKVQVKNQMRREADLARCRQPLSSDPDYQKALRFADDKQKEIYSGYNRAILERIDLEQKEAVYREAVALENRAAVEKEFITAAQKFDAAGEIRDAKERAANCRAKAASAKAEAEKAAAAYKEQMERERRERERQEEERRIAEEQRAEQEKQEAEKKKKRNKKILAIAAALMVLAGGVFVVYDKVIQPKIKFDNAQKLLDENKYDEAIIAFTKLGNYANNGEKIQEVHYKKGINLLESGKYDQAMEEFTSAGEYDGAQQMLTNTKNYILAHRYYGNQDYLSAMSLYSDLGSFLDSETKLADTSRIVYGQLKTNIANKNYAMATQCYAQLKDYADCSEIVSEIETVYEEAGKAWQAGKKGEAETGYSSIAGWRDTEEKLAALREEIADDAFAAGDYSTALEYYEKANTEDPATKGKIAETKKRIAYKEANDAFADGDLASAYQAYIDADDYEDAKEKAEQISKYQEAVQLLTEGEYFEARTAFASLEGFLDSAEQLEQCNQTLYIEATDLLEQGKTAEAYEAFESISDYSDSGEIVAKMDSDYQTAIEHIEKGERFEAETILVSITGWRDVDDRLETLREEIADQAMEESDFNTAVAYYNKLNNRTETTEEKLAKATQGKNYQEAVAALESSDLETAYTMFIAAGDYEDAADQAGKLDAYQKAKAAMAEGKYQEARKEYIQLGSYLDSAKNLETCNAALYQEAASSKENGDFAKAYKLFELISGYSDSAEMVQQMKDDYTTADELLKNGKYDEANSAFIALYNYSDSETKAQESLYQKAEALKASGLFDDAVVVYTNLGKYKDSGEKINICLYSKAESLLENKDVDGSIAIFESIPDYSDSLERAKALRYEKAKTLWDNGELQSARAEYEALGDYSDASVLLTKVLTEIADNALANKEYATALSAYQGLEQTAEVQEREYKLAQVCYDEGYYAEATAAYETLGQYELSLSKLPIARYAWADQLFNNGEYEKAAEQFALLGDMTDSATRANESIYQLASEKLTAKSYDDAKKLFIGIADYKDADTFAKECDYRKATDLLVEGKNEDAETIFKSLGEYSDSKTRAEECIYNQAEILFTAEKYAEAKLLYDIITYSDSQTKSKQCVYNQAEARFNDGDYKGAKSMYESINYLDSQDKAKESAYREADVLYQEKKYADAETIFLSVPGYNDSDDRAKDCHLQQGKVLLDAEDYKGALIFFESVDYEDSASLAARCHYELGRALHLAGNTDEAISEYAYAVSMPETQTTLISAAKDYVVINEYEKAIQTLWLIRDLDNASTELKTIAQLANENQNAYLALVAFSSFDNNEDTHLGELIKKASYDSFKRHLNMYSLIPESFLFKEFIIYRFAISARDSNNYSIAIEALNDIEEYKNAKQIKNECYYLKGLAEYDGQLWDEAIASFKQASHYLDSQEKITDTKYYKALSLQAKGKWEEAIQIFEEIKTYLDSETQITETKYLRANANLANGNGRNAYDEYLEIIDYKDVANILNTNEIMINEQLKDRKEPYRQKGNVVQFGTYMDNAIDWYIADISGDTILLLSKDIIDYQYVCNEDHISWSDSYLREWLNNDFFKLAFNEKEKNAIIATEFEVSINGYYNGNKTIDKVGLVGYDMMKTIGEDMINTFEMTPYALQRATTLKIKQTDRDEWFLCGRSSYNKYYIYKKDFHRLFDTYTAIRSGIRPVIYLNLEKYITHIPVGSTNADVAEEQYQEALKEIEAENYLKAREILLSIYDYENYKDCDALSVKCIYLEGEKLLDEGKFDEAIEQFQSILKYKDSSTMVKECLYRKGISLINSGHQDEGIEILQTVMAYKDTKNVLEETLAKTRHKQITQKGSVISIGSYNGKSLYWRVLDIRNNKSLVISTESVASMPFDETGRSNNWGSSSLKKWLEKDFYKAAFSEAEQKEIIGQITIFSKDEMIKYNAEVEDAWTTTKWGGNSKGIEYNPSFGGAGWWTYERVDHDMKVYPVMWLKHIQDE